MSHMPRPPLAVGKASGSPYPSPAGSLWVHRSQGLALGHVQMAGSHSSTSSREESKSEAQCRAAVGPQVRASPHNTSEMARHGKLLGWSQSLEVRPRPRRLSVSAKALHLRHQRFSLKTCRASELLTELYLLRVSCVKSVEKGSGSLSHRGRFKGLALSFRGYEMDQIADALLFCWE